MISYISVWGMADRKREYSITVNDLYLTANAIYIDTNLIGPAPENKELYKAQERNGASYPYVVVKMEYLDEAVVLIECWGGVGILLVGEE